eukprot:10544-Heterococcus_DN1.PRE.1
MRRYNRRRRRNRKPQCSLSKEEKFKDRAELRVHIRANALARIRAIGLSRVALNLGLITEQGSAILYANHASTAVLLRQDLDTSSLMSSVQLRLQLSDSAAECIADDSRPLTAPALEQHQLLRPAETTEAAVAQALMPAPPPRQSKRMAGIDSMVWRGKLVTGGAAQCCSKGSIQQTESLNIDLSQYVCVFCTGYKC